MDKKSTCIRRNSVFFALIIFILSGVILFAQDRPYDYKGDTQKIPFQIVIDLKAGAFEVSEATYTILDKVISGKIVKMDGFYEMISPGDPLLPYKIYDIAVPPNIDWKTLKLTFDETEEISISGDYDIPPTPPMRARVYDEDLVFWGEGKDIVGARNLKVYGKDEFFPKQPIKIITQSQMRKWKFIRLGYYPVQYNPVTKKLRVVKSIRVQFDFDRIGTMEFKHNPILRDTIMDGQAGERFLNFNEAVNWYIYVKPQRPVDEPEDPDYVIITTKDIVSNSTELTKFVAHKVSLGHSVKIVTETDYGGMVGQAPNGIAEKIRQWLINNYIALGIHYVLLIGDPDPDDPSDPVDTVGDIPMKMCWPNRTYYMDRDSPTDYFYADLNGNWDLDGDGFYGENLRSIHFNTPDPSVGEDTFSVRWTGKIEVDTAGTYQFRSLSDDGFRLIIDGTKVIDNWTSHPLTTDYGSIDLTVGQHTVTVEHYDNTEDAFATLYWSPPGGYYTVIPSTKLYHLVGGVYTSGGLDGEYFNNPDFTGSVLTRVDSNIEFNWATGDLGLGGVDFSADVFVGRIPVYGSDYTTLDSILKKIRTYESSSPPAWRKKILFAASDLSVAESDWRLGEAIKNDFAGPAGISMYRVYEDYNGLTPPPECSAVNPKNIDPTAECNMLQEWANGGGYGIVAWSSHGQETFASHLISSSDNTHLSDGVPAFTFHGCCFSGYPENPNNLGYALLKQGAIATVSASRASGNICFSPTIGPNPNWGTNANLIYYYLNRLIQDQSAGHALYITKANVDAIAYWINKMDYNLYGDPSSSLLKKYGGVSLLFDSSGSMSWRHDGSVTAIDTERRLWIAKEAASSFLELLNDHSNHRINFGITAFPPRPWNYTVGCNGQIITPMTRIDDTSKTTAITTTIPGLVAEGNTPLLAGMKTAMSMFGTEDHRVVILLSDGYHNCPSAVNTADTDFTDLVDDLKTKKIKVFTIGLGRPTDVDHPLLEALAADTGGEFHDVTTATFNPATWNPMTDLQATYKSILIDTLGLETAADPAGIIIRGDKIIRHIKINENDQRVSFFLSWVKPDINRLSIKIKSSDQQYLPVSATNANQSITVHSGKTYYIVTVDESFLRESGKVGAPPWRLEIEAPQLNAGESEHYQYSVVLSSRLKMSTEFDQSTYETGDTITLSVKLMEKGNPITGLSNVNVTVIRPDEGLGNWYADNKVAPDLIEQVPEKRENEMLSLLQRKAIYLTDNKKVTLPGVTDPSAVKLYDDGSHGDVTADDGIYTVRITNLVKEGTYSFYVQASGSTDGGNFFQREDMIDKYITVKVEPVNTQVEALPIAVGDLKQFQIIVTPRDSYGNYLGPRYSNMIKITASHGSFLGRVEDDLEGNYMQALSLPASVNINDVNVNVEIKGKTISFNLGEKIPHEKLFGASLHIGRSNPRGNFDILFNDDFSFTVDVEYKIRPQIFVVGLVGYNSFSHETDSTFNTYWSNVSVNFKYMLTPSSSTPFTNGGIGLYFPEFGSNKFGFNIGAGYDFAINPNLIFEAGLDFHRIIADKDDKDFYVPHVGIIIRF